MCGCLFQWWHLLPAGLTSPTAHAFPVPPSWASPAHAVLGDPPSPSHVAPPSWRNPAWIDERDPGPETGCLEASNSMLSFLDGRAEGKPHGVQLLAGKDLVPGAGIQGRTARSPPARTGAACQQQPLERQNKQEPRELHREQMRGASVRDAVGKQIPVLAGAHRGGCNEPPAYYRGGSHAAAAGQGRERPPLPGARRKGHRH